MVEVAEYNETENPYRSSAGLTTATAFEDTAEHRADSQETLLRAFVGPRADRYLERWAPRLADPNGEVGMNWAAFLLPVFWFGYRKMYRAAFLLFGATFAEAIVQDLFFIFVLGLKQSPPGVTLVVNIMFGIVCGLYANLWYLSHAQKCIVQAYARGYEGDELLYVLSQRGGTSVLSGIGVTLACGLLAFVAVMVMAAFLVVTGLVALPG